MRCDMDYGLLSGAVFIDLRKAASLILLITKYLLGSQSHMDLRLTPKLPDRRKQLVSFGKDRSL